MTDPAAIRERARAIYARDYVAPLNLDPRHSRVLAKVVDFAVVAGVRRSAEALQRALNASGYGLTEDGAIGDKTRAAIDVEVVRNGEAGLLAQLCRQHALHFVLVASTNSGQRHFLLGWVSRGLRMPA